MLLYVQCMKTTNKHKANGALAVLLYLFLTLTPSLQIKKKSNTAVCCEAEIISDCLERKIILMLKLLSSHYYTSIYFEIKWESALTVPDYSTVASEVRALT